MGIVLKPASVAGTKSASGKIVDSSYSTLPNGMLHETGRLMMFPVESIQPAAEKVRWREEQSLDSHVILK